MFHSSTSQVHCFPNEAPMADQLPYFFLGLHQSYENLPYYPPSRHLISSHIHPRSFTSAALHRTELSRSYEYGRTRLPQRAWASSFELKDGGLFAQSELMKRGFNFCRAKTGREEFFQGWEYIHECFFFFVNGIKTGERRSSNFYLFLSFFLFVILSEKIPRGCGLACTSILIKGGF